MEGKSPAMKANSEVPKERTSESDGPMRNDNGTSRTRTRVPKERTSESDGPMRNDNGTSRTRTRVIKKPNRYDDCVM